MSQEQLSEACRADVEYLRTRSRYTPELEAQLIALHKAGTPPNVFEFGCTPATGQALVDAALAALKIDKRGGESREFEESVGNWD